MFRKVIVAGPIVVLAVGGSTACATKDFVRTERRRSQRQGRLARSLGRGHAGADAAQRRPHHGSRSARRRRRAVGGRRPNTAAAEAQTSANTANAAANAARLQGRSGRGVVAAPRIRGRVERGPGQLQVRQGRAAGRSQGPPRSADHRSSRPIRRVPTSRSKGTPTTSGESSPTRRSGSSAPKR